MNRIYWILGLFALEVLAIVLVFQVFSSVECRLTGIETACRGLRSVMIRALCLGVGLGVFAWFRPHLWRQLGETSATRGRFETRFWSFVHLIGLCLIFLPWLNADPATLNQNFASYFGILALGGACLALGGVLLLVPAAGWVQFARSGGVGLALVMGVCVLIPDLADALAPLWWSLSGLLWATFYGVAVVLAVLGNDVTLDPGASVIGTREFFVEMAGTCSGIEGFALTTGFFVIYSVLMRDTIRMGLFWAIVFPVALLVSWIFNVFRIAALILIGAHVSPELAVNGFHSFAGWLFFTILALGVLWVVQSLPALHKEPEQAEASGQRMSDLLPLTQDPAAAYIVPFIAFMISGLFAQTFWQHPEQAYPLQVAVMAVVLWLFRRPYLALRWGLDPVAIAAGVGVGVGWLLTAQAGQPDQTTAKMAGLEGIGTAALMAWAICRVIGTSVLVPVIEEGFFRGYLLRWLDGAHMLRTLSAVAVSSVAFALLHGRLIEAGVAGVIFALIALRRGRVSDAIQAHAAANIVIAIAALTSGDWSLI